MADLANGTKMRLVIERRGGASRDRTDDLIVANYDINHFRVFRFNELNSRLVHYWYSYRPNLNRRAASVRALRPTPATPKNGGTTFLATLLPFPRYRFGARLLFHDAMIACVMTLDPHSSPPRTPSRTFGHFISSVLTRTI
jgi:hypothetical protein